MNSAELEYFVRQYQRTKEKRSYLENWNDLSQQEKLKSMKDNKDFWDDLFDDTPLVEDASPKKSPDIKNVIDPQKLSN